MGAAHLNYLDGWRGLAISFLLIGHFFPVPGINLGIAGVNLFFVLSGLLMARLLFVQKVPISLFYKRRISRIFPAVFFFLVAVVLTYLARGRAIDWAEVTAAATFLINYFPGEPGNAVMPFGHIWSLCVEEHSYILLSAIAVTARRRVADDQRMTALFTTLFAMAGIYYWTQYMGERLDFERWIHSEVSAFGIFASAFLLLFFRDRRIPSLPVFAYPALLAFGFAMHWWSVPQPIRTIAGVGAFALAVNLLAGAPKLIQSALSFRPLRQVGIWSFSIYLWQQPFYLYVHREEMPKLLGISLALIFGIASFYLLEKPARGYLNRRWAGDGSSVKVAQVKPI